LWISFCVRITAGVRLRFRFMPRLCARVRVSVIVRVRPRCRIRVRA
jgi:hypothetical protein